jgi:4-amino-4-deoxy-L-arabinose transferase-like glycosyltransferase
LGAAVEGARRRLLIAAALAAATLVLYGWRLDDSPMHLHYDELFFGLQGHSIHSTGRDMNGLRLPVYFQLESTMNWYQPVAVYWTAAVLTVLPLSDAAIRWPTVLAGTANVVLMFYLAFALFRRTSWAVVAALLLMLTPAHFIHSRVAMDYVYPLPFLMAWMICILHDLERPSKRMLFAATSFLGLGFFSYIAGTALTPMYLAATLAVMASRHDFRRMPVAIAGFAWPLVAAALFIAVHPEVVPQLLAKYDLDSAESASGLDALQRVRESFNNNAVSDALNRYWRFYSPGYLFVTGGANLTNSTRAAGVFLPPLALLMLAGGVQAIVRWRVVGAIVWFGFLTAAIPAAVLPEEFTIDRELAKVPFAILLAVMGAEWLWRTSAAAAVAVTTKVIAGLIALLGAGYAVLTLVTRGEISASPPLLLAVAAGLFALGIAIERRRNWSPAVVALLLLVPVLFVPFVRDYFDGYRLRSAGWFGGNIRGAIEETIRRADAAKAPEIHLSTDIPYIRTYWRFYLLSLEREDLFARTRVFDRLLLDSWNFPSGAVVLAAASDQSIGALAQRGQLRPLATVADAPDSPLEEQFVIYSR